MKFNGLTAAAVLAALALVVSGCGSDDDPTSASDNAATGNQLDAMFVTGMIPHHQSAIDMARLGESSAKHEEIKTLSANIIESQQAEIEQMNTLATELPNAKNSMMSEQEMAGMMSDVDSLENANNFDKAFIDAMIPHHQSAVRMANRVIADGENPEVKKLAQAIVKAQAKEIADMQTWRTEWFGAPLPNAESSSMGSMHDGH